MLILWLGKWFMYSIIIMGVCYFLPGIYISSFSRAFIVAFTLALLNIFVKPVLVILTLPLTFLTLGLFIVVINVIIFYAVAALVDGFVINNFFHAVIASIIISVLSKILV